MDSYTQLKLKIRLRMFLFLSPVFFIISIRRGIFSKEGLASIGIGIFCFMIGFYRMKYIEPNLIEYCDNVELTIEKDSK